ncbi:MAG: hypothetical protein ACC645_13435 [Pirellulales bacterium]
MPRFHYRALNHDQQVVAGDIQAETVLQAITELESRGLTVQSIGHTPYRSEAESSERSGSRAGAEDAAGAARTMPVDGDSGQVILQSHLEDLLQRGKAIAPVLHAYAKDMPPGRRHRQLLAVIDILERGDVGSATSTFAAMSDDWVPLLAAATSSSKPDCLLEGFVTRSQAAHQFRRQWGLVLAYPLLVACLAAAVITALCFIVVPTFREIFLDFELELPGATQLLLTLSESIRSGRFLVIVAALLAIGFLGYAVVRLLPDAFADAFRWMLPSQLGRSVSIGKLARYTADLFDAGFELPDAVRVAGLATNRPRLNSGAADLARNIGPDAISIRPGPRRLLTATFVHAVRAELPRSARTRLLREISECHADRARAHLSWTNGFIGPIAICVVAVVVGWTVIALFLPLVDLIQALT